MKFKNLLASAAIASAIAFTGTVQAADLVIGVPNWPSVRVTAHVLKVVMEDNLGLEVELQNGTNPVVFEGMDAQSGKPEQYLCEGKGICSHEPERCRW